LLVLLCSGEQAGNKTHLVELKAIITYEITLGQQNNPGGAFAMTSSMTMEIMTLMRFSSG
jgi:hypothetical protein